LKHEVYQNNIKIGSCLTQNAVFLDYKVKRVVVVVSLKDNFSVRKSYKMHRCTQ
jgi:hypothetical protein